MGYDKTALEPLLARLSISTMSGLFDNIHYTKILLALAAIENGADVMDVCHQICWKDFEVFASEIMKFNNFRVLVNFRIKNPTRQIDVIGTRSNLALVVDCKHWKKTSYTAIKVAVRKQKERCLILNDKHALNGINKMYPIIVTFIPLEYQQIDQVPVIPIQLFNSFLLDFDTYNENYFSI